MKEIAVLGSTGSIGIQTLEVIRLHKDLFHIHVLAARILNCYWNKLKSLNLNILLLQIKQKPMLLDIFMMEMHKYLTGKILFVKW